MEKHMNSLAVVGLQWGDEGKGKVIDVLSQEMEHIVRCQGGHNAGHTVVANGKEYHFHLVPSGILYPHTTCYLGGGTVIDPSHLLSEIQALERQGISTEGRLKVSPYAHVILPYHKRLDHIREQRASVPIGTTGRGIGPCYEDGVARKGIRVSEWVDSGVFKKRLSPLIAEKNRLLALDDAEEVDFERVYEEYVEYGKFLKSYIDPFENELDAHLKKGSKVLFEGAQGAMLDVRFGTYPFVTSSMTTSSGLTAGAGVGVNRIKKTIGVLKAYSTRVGNGPFPTELFPDEMALFPDLVQAREFGTTTGRKRRIGWLDIPLLKEAVRLSGVDSLALTKLDIFDEFQTIKLCIAYENQKSLPSFHGNWESLRPVYEELPGWNQSLSQIKHVEEFPKNVRLFVSRIEALLECPIEILSFGPEREKTLLLR